MLKKLSNMDSKQLYFFAFIQAVTGFAFYDSCIYSSLSAGSQVASMCTNDRVQSLDSSFSSSANLAVNTTGIGYDSTGSCSCSAIITNNNELQNMSVTVSSIRILDRAVRDTSSNLTSACSSSFRILTENRSYKYACQSPQVSFTVMTNQRFGLEYHKTTGNDGGNYCIRTSFSSRSLIPDGQTPILTITCEPFRDIFRPTSEPSTTSTSAEFSTTETSVSSTSASSTTSSTNGDPAVISQPVCDDDSLSIIIPVVILILILLATVIVHILLYRRREHSENEDTKQSLHLTEDPTQTPTTNIVSNQPMQSVRSTTSSIQPTGEYTSIRRGDVVSNMYDVTCDYDTLNEYNRNSTRSNNAGYTIAREHGMPTITPNDQKTEPSRSPVLEQTKDTSTVKLENTELSQVGYNNLAMDQIDLAKRSLPYLEMKHAHLLKTDSDSTDYLQPSNAYMNSPSLGGNTHVKVSSTDSVDYIHPNGHI